MNKEAIYDETAARTEALRQLDAATERMARFLVGDTKMELVKAIVLRAQRAIEAELPEDEPDTIPEWCYIKIVETALAELSRRGTR